MTAVDNNTGRFLSSLPFFARLPAGDLAALMTAAQVRDYRKQQGIFHRGDRADRFFVIISGWVKLHRGNSEGEEAVVALFTRGDVFGEAAIFGDGNYPFGAEAAEETRLAEIPAQVLKDRAKSNPDITARVMASMSREMHQLQMETEHRFLMSAPQRVGCLLLQLSAGMVGKGGTFSFPYDKSLAAQRLGMKPETFSRALKELQAAGVAVKGSEIAIDSFARLVDFSCTHCSSLPGECAGARTAGCGETSCPGKTRKAGDQ